MAASIGKRADGHMYYVIGGSSSSSNSGSGDIENFTVVNTIEERDLVGQGMVLVRQANVDDTTINSGWGLYVYDKSNRSWIKIAEEESVEGGANITEILANYVTTTAFNTYVASNNADKNSILQAIAKSLSFTVNASGQKTVSGNILFNNDLNWSGNAGYSSPFASTEDRNEFTRNGWYIGYINDNNYTYTTKAGTIDVYVQSTQPTLASLLSNTADAVYNASFDSGFVVGSLVYIRNVTDSIDCAKVVAVSGNKITLGEFKAQIINTPGTKYVKKWEYLPEDDKTYYVRNYIKASATGHLDSFDANTTYYTMVDGVPTLVDTTAAADTSKIYYIVSGFTKAANDGHPDVFLDGWEYFFSSEIAYKYSDVNNTTEELKLNPDQFSIAMTRSATADVDGAKSFVNPGIALLNGGSFVNGFGCAAFGQYSSVFGLNSVSYGRYSITIGTGLYNTIHMSTIIGSYNEINEEPIVFAVGIGTDAANRADGLRVYKDGRVWVNQISKLRTVNASSASTSLLAQRVNKMLVALGAEAAVQTYPSFAFAGGAALTYDQFEFGKITDGSEVLVVPSKSNGLFYTVDGINYIQSNITTGSFDRPLFDSVNKRFIATGTGGILYSDDGKSWTVADSTSAAKVVRQVLTDTSIKFLSGCKVSTDGAIWSSGTNFAAGKSGAIIETEDEGVVYVANCGTDGLKYSDDEGATWTAIAATASTEYNDLCYGQDKDGKGFIIATPITADKDVLYTFDGINWSVCSSFVDGTITAKQFTGAVAYTGGVVVVCSAGTETTGKGIWYTADFVGGTTVWNHVSNISKGAYYTPREIDVNGNRYKISTPYGYSDYLVASKDGKVWVKTRLALNALNPSILKGIVSLPMQSDAKGVRLYSEEEFADVLESAFESASRSTYIAHINDDWNEDTLTDKINEIIDVINNLM